MKGKFFTDPEGRLNYEIFNWIDEWNTIVREKISEKFNLTAVGNLSASYDDSSQKFKQNDLRVDLDWSIWDGFAVRAVHPDSNSLVKEIAEYLEKLEVDFSKKPGIIKGILGL